MKASLICGLLLLCSGGLVCAADESASAISIGPFRTGMSFEEARAAAPALSWTEKKGTLDSRYQRMLKAPDAIQLGGGPYEIQLIPGWHGAYTMVLGRQATVENAKACTKVYEEMLADLEGRFGSFDASETKYENESALVTLGKPTKTESRNAGKSSNYTYHATASYTESVAVLRQPAGELWAYGKYFVGSTMFGESSCITSFKIAVGGHPPEFEEIPEIALKPVLTPSIAVLHDSLEHVTLPPEGRTIAARCMIDRTSGQVGKCTLDPATPKELAAAVSERSNHLAFAIDALDPGNRVPLYSTLTFRFDPAQRLTIGKPVDVLDGSSLTWADEWAEVPIASIRTAALSKLEYDSATATATCQIKADGSLLCGELAVTVQEGSDASEGSRGLFAYKARQALSTRRAPPTLTDGSPSTGKWVRIDLPIRNRRR